MSTASAFVNAVVPCDSLLHSRKLCGQRQHFKWRASVNTGESGGGSGEAKSDGEKKRGFRRLATSIGIGAAGASVGSLIGAGGGIVFTPLMTTLLGVSQHAAHGTSLAAITVTAAISALRYGRASQLNAMAALTLTCSAALTSSIGAQYSARVKTGALRRYFGIFLLAVSVLIPTLAQLEAAALVAALPSIAKTVMLVVIGLVSGFLSGILGIGGGTINVPALVIVAGFSQKIAQGTTLLAMLLPTTLASVTHAKLGQLRVDVLPGLIIGAFLGSSMGAELAIFLPERILRYVCSLLFFALGVRYIAQSRLSPK